MTLWLKRAAVALLLSPLTSHLSPCLAQGSLTPPGAPAPTMKSLDQIEPRVPIYSLPFTITNAGSYYVVSNLTGSVGVNGVTISTNSVTVDLNGFALVGVPGSGGAVLVSSSYTNILITNGRISGWSGVGVDAFSFDYPRNVIIEHLTVSFCGAGIQVEDQSSVKDCVVIGNLNRGLYSVGGLVSGVNAAENGSDGIYAGSAVLEHCRGVGNKGYGIQVGNRCVLEHCLAFGNTNSGIFVASSCTVKDCTAANNGGDGITAYTGNTITGCTADSNGTNGISAGNGSAVLQCTASLNSHYGFTAAGGSTISDCTAFQNFEGILAQGSSSILRNTSDYNSFNGIRAIGGDNRIEGNHLVSNASYGILIQIQNAHDVVVKNSASANGANYSIATGNDVGPIGTAAASTSPWANISN